MAPKEDVRAAADGGCLLELELWLGRMGNRYLDSCLRGVLLSDLGNTVVALVAVDPDGQLVLLNRSAGDKGGSERSDRCE